MHSLRFTILITTLSCALAAATPEGPDFAPIGGSYGQTVRISISSYAPPCSGAVGFRLGETTPPDPDRSFKLSGGQTAFYDLNLNRLAGRFGVRVEVTPHVVVLDGSCTASVEVFEQFTGRTTAFRRLFGAQTPSVPGTNTNPPPEPEFAPLGAANGQIVRLGVGRQSGDNTFAPPCRGTLAFMDVQGNVVGATRTFDLLPGQRAFLDFDPSKIPATNATLAARTTVWPRYYPPPCFGDVANSVCTSTPNFCVASVQVYESSTGWSTEAVNGR